MPFQPFDKGYDVTATKRPTPPGSNGTLTFRKTVKELWVYDVTIGLQMSGVTGQSYRTRSYFPHNMVQPSFTVACQFPNQELYGDVVEFLRWTQTTFDSSLRLDIVSNARTPTRHHRDISAEGYVKSVPRKHERHVYAPELSFGFVVETMHAGLGSEKPAQIQELATWNDIVQNQDFQGNPDTAQGDNVPDNAHGN